MTAASAANYYTFLGDVQEGQGTIAEDEADDIGEDKVKQRILKTGYASGGTVPKIEFSRNGTRSQKPYLTYCHKWLAMEEIPDERKIRGVLDRSFIFKFLDGEVEHNIKDVEQAENSELFEKIKDLRKTLFAFKFLHQSDKFEDIHINVKNRNAELTKPLLRLFNNSKAQEQILKALAVLIKEKSRIKSNSTEAKVFEALNDLIYQDFDENIDVYQFTNDQIFEGVKRAMDGLENQFDGTYSTFITPDGLYVSKKKLKQILVSKFNVVADRVKIGGRTERVIRISKKWLDKLGKQYEVIDGIDFVNSDKGFCESDTMTDVTLLHSASPDFDKEFDAKDTINSDDPKINRIDENSDYAYTNCETDHSIKSEELSEYDDDARDAKLNLISNNSSKEENEDETRMGPQGPSNLDESDKVINNDSSINMDTNNRNKQLADIDYARVANTTPTASMGSDNPNSLNKQLNYFQDKIIDDISNNNETLEDNQSTKNIENMGQALPESVTSVTSVTTTPHKLKFYINCQFCPEYYAETYDEVYKHKLDMHKMELLKYSKIGGLNVDEEKLVDKIKMSMKETSRILDEDDI